MRRYVVALAIAVLLITAPSARADDGASFGAGDDRGTVSGQVTTGSGTPGGGRSSAPTSRGGGSRGGSGGGSAPTLQPVIRNEERIVWEGENGRLTVINDPYRDYCHGTVGHTICYGEYTLPDPRPGGRAPAPPPPPPSAIAETTIVNLPLPQPEPEIDPGWAITGLKAYLETGNSTSHTFEPVDTVLGPLSVSATSTYTVDWGDGTVTGPHATSGGPYPNGTLTHIYQRTGTYDVTVTQNWTATWSLAGQSGQVSGLVTRGTIPDLTVEQVQAIRRR